jgi:hypothetical protein
MKQELARTSGGYLPATRSPLSALAVVRENGSLLEVFAGQNVPMITGIQAELTVASAHAGGLQLSRIRKENPETGEDAIAALLDITLAQFNLPRIMDGGQIALLAEDILRRYPLVKFEELVYICREAITGKYSRGEKGFFGGISAFHIHGWINDYLQGEREQYLETASFEAAKEHRADYRAPIAGETLAEYYRRLKWEAYLEPDAKLAVKEGRASWIKDKPKPKPIQREETPEYLETLKLKLADPQYGDDKLEAWRQYYQRHNLTEAENLTFQALKRRGYKSKTLKQTFAANVSNKTTKPNPPGAL